jgi:hypothetical protein
MELIAIFFAVTIKILLLRSMPWPWMSKLQAPRAFLTPLQQLQPGGPGVFHPGRSRVAPHEAWAKILLRSQGPSDRHTDTPTRLSPSSVFRAYLLEYRLIPRVVWFELEGLLCRRLGFGNAA